jgi:hypothetical protein
MNKIEIANFCTKHNITLKQFFGFDELDKSLDLRTSWYLGEGGVKEDSFIPEGFYPKLKKFNNIIHIKNGEVKFIKHSDNPGEISYSRRIEYKSKPYTSNVSDINLDRTLIRKGFYDLYDDYTKPDSKIKQCVDFMSVRNNKILLLDETYITNNSWFNEKHICEDSLIGAKLEYRNRIIKHTVGLLQPMLNNQWVHIDRLPMITGCYLKEIHSTHYIDINDELIYDDLGEDDFNIENYI